MKQVSGKDFPEVLIQKGWELKRIHGSHHVYPKPERKERISLPIHGNKPLKIGLLRHLMKVADINEAELYRTSREEPIEPAEELKRQIH